MAGPQNNESLAAMKRTRDEIRQRLEQNPDFQAYLAQTEAIEKVEALQPRAPGTYSHRDAVYHDLSDVVRTKPITQLDAAVQAIAEAGKPLTTGELVEAARKLGAHVGGKDPRINLGSSLSRDERFKSVQWGDGRAWWFKGRPLPARTSLGDAAQESEAAGSSQGKPAAPSHNH